MKDLPEKLRQSIENRKAQNALRILHNHKDLIDFSSNDYLGYATDKKIFQKAHQLLLKRNLIKNGATGSRLLSGNLPFYEEAEDHIRLFHNATTALIFNSGYDANVGFFSSVPQRGDLILYDEYIHASIRDGIRMSTAKAYKFAHNDLEHLEERLKQFAKIETVYIITESVFSMDGDSPDIIKLIQLAKRYHAYTIIDEAHAVGVFGHQGRGLLQQLGIEQLVFARIITFGKAMGCHGAAILGSDALKTYLINFARSFIYTTALSPHAIATIIMAYQQLKNEKTATNRLIRNIDFFNQKVQENLLNRFFIPSQSAIRCCVIPGNEKVKHIALQLQQNGFDVKPILAPTVSRGKERLRFCLHSYNTKDDIEKVIDLLRTFVA